MPPVKAEVETYFKQTYNKLIFIQTLFCIFGMKSRRYGSDLSRNFKNVNDRLIVAFRVSQSQLQR
jgi:hypothetical protein